MSTEPTPSGLPIPVVDGDFIPLPAKVVTIRGVPVSRSTLIRAEKEGRIKSKLFRQPGRVKGRRFLLLSSVNTWLDECMVDAPIEGPPRPRKKGKTSEWKDYDSKFDAWLRLSDEERKTTPPPVSPEGVRLT